MIVTNTMICHADRTARLTWSLYAERKAELSRLKSAERLTLQEARRFKELREIVSSLRGDLELMLGYR